MLGIGLVAAVGAFSKGLIATGRGEMNDDFFLERCEVFGRASVATGAYVLQFATATVAPTHVARFALQGSAEMSLLSSVLVFSVPGVLIGGQIGPCIATRLSLDVFDWILRVLLLGVAPFGIAEALL